MRRMLTKTAMLSAAAAVVVLASATDASAGVRCSGSVVAGPVGVTFVTGPHYGGGTVLVAPRPLYTWRTVPHYCRPHVTFVRPRQHYGAFRLHGWHGLRFRRPCGVSVRVGW